jgi:hypothetical protein
MDITRAIVEVGTQAVIHYRQRRAIKDETRIPENALSLFIASELITQFNLDARVEVPYPNILNSLGVTGSDVTPKFGGQRADVAVYEEKRPAAVVEVKIVDERRRLSGVVRDWGKIRLLQQYVADKAATPLDGYVAAVVCDTNKPAEQTIVEMEQSLGSVTIERGRKTATLAGEWGWRFVCVKLA